MKDNKQLSNLYKDDQDARQHTSSPLPSKTWEQITAEDQKRRKRVDRLIKENKLHTANDYYHAAMIFQHGSSVDDFTLANELAKISMDMGSEDAKWLYAATTDRLLRTQGKKQKFGTQYEWVVLKEGEKYYDAMLLQPCERKTTDKMRAKYNVPPFSELKRRETKKRRS